MANSSHYWLSMRHQRGLICAIAYAALGCGRTSLNTDAERGPHQDAKVVEAGETYLCAPMQGQYTITHDAGDSTGGQSSFNLSLSIDANCSARLMPEDGYPAAYNVSAQSGQLTIAPVDEHRLACARVAYRVGIWDDDCWKQLLVAPDIDAGGLTGTVSATVDHYSFMCDTDADEIFEAQGQIAEDHTPPRLRLMVPGDWLDCSWLNNGTRLRLPWSPVVVAASEPVPGLQQGLAFGATVPTISGWHQVTGTANCRLPTLPPDTYVSTMFQNWQDLRGRTLSLSPSNGLSDTAGNKVVAGDLSLVIADVGPAVPAHEFNGQFVGIQYDKSLDQLVSDFDPDCSATGCMRVEVGIAGQLETTGKKTLVVRLRNLSDGYSEGGGAILTVVGGSGTSYGSPQLYPITGWEEVRVPIGDEGAVGFEIARAQGCMIYVEPVLVDRVYAE
jgi:hypothetical protein